MFNLSIFNLDIGTCIKCSKNFTNLNRIALNLLKQNKTKIGVKSKRKMAGWTNDFVFELIKN